MRREIAVVDSLLAQGAADEALPRVQQLWRTSGEDPIYGWQVTERLGVALSMVGEDERALVHLEAVLRRAPGVAAHHRNLATALVHLQRRGRALSEYAVAVELAPEDPDMQREYGQVLLAFGDLARAEIALETAGQLCGQCPALDGPLAELFLRQGKAAAAVPYLARLNAEDPSIAHRREWMVAMSRAGFFAQLVGALAPIPAVDRAVWEWRLLVLAEGELGQVAATAGLVDWLVAAGADSLPDELASDDHFWGQVALNLLAGGDGRRGLAAVERAIALAPESVVYHNNRVVLLIQLGREDEARQEWALVHKLDPSLAH